MKHKRAGHTELPYEAERAATDESTDVDERAVMSELPEP